MTRRMEFSWAKRKGAVHLAIYFFFPCTDKQSGEIWRIKYHFIYTPLFAHSIPSLATALKREGLQDFRKISYTSKKNVNVSVNTSVRTCILRLKSHSSTPLNWLNATELLGSGSHSNVFLDYTKVLDYVSQNPAFLVSCIPTSKFSKTNHHHIFHLEKQHRKLCMENSTSTAVVSEVESTGPDTCEATAGRNAAH